jgi:hypothetical protein
VFTVTLSYFQPAYVPPVAPAPVAAPAPPPAVNNVFANLVAGQDRGIEEKGDDLPAEVEVCRRCFLSMFLSSFLFFLCVCVQVVDLQDDEDDDDEVLCTGSTRREKTTKYLYPRLCKQIKKTKNYGIRRYKKGKDEEEDD